MQVPPNATTVSTKHNDIAHFTCTALGQDTVRWKREGEDLKEEDLGVAILSALKNLTGSLESHLLIAVTSDDLRGKYECFSSADSNAAQHTFFIGSKKMIPCYTLKQNSAEQITHSQSLYILVITLNAKVYFYRKPFFV